MNEGRAATQIVRDESLAPDCSVEASTATIHEKVDQYAALCLRSGKASGAGLEVLLITSRDTGRWVIPKGWPMRGKKPHQVARREAWEEAGVCGRVQKTRFGYYRYVKSASENAPLPCLVEVYVVAVSELNSNFPEHGQRELRWFTPAEAAAVVKDVELAGLLLSLAGDAAPTLLAR